MEDETVKVRAAIGGALLFVQLVERLLDASLWTAFRGESVPIAQELERAEKLERTETLGQLIYKLRQRVEIHPKMEQYLQTFLDNRNRLVHHLLDSRETELTQKEARQRLSDFCKEVTKSGMRLLKLFTAILIKWKLSLERDHSLDAETKAYLEEAEEWPTTIDQLFRIREKALPDLPRRKRRR